MDLKSPPQSRPSPEFLRKSAPSHSVWLYLAVTAILGVSTLVLGRAHGSETRSVARNSAAQPFTGEKGTILVPVPEPNSIGVLAGSIGLALGLQRFRRRRN